MHEGLAQNIYHSIITPNNGFISVGGFNVSPMGVLLAVAIGVIIYLVWNAQRDKENRFDIWDLVMEDGKASVSKVTFAMAFIMTTWVIVDRELRGVLDGAFFGLYLAGWVGPLTARIVFGKKDPPAMPDSLKMTETTITQTTAPKPPKKGKDE